MITFQDLETLLNQGGEIKMTDLTDEFSFEDYMEIHRDKRLPLFAIDENESIYVFSPGNQFKPKQGWSILALETGDQNEKLAKSKSKRQPAPGLILNPEFHV